MYFDKYNPNPMFIFVGGNWKTSIIQKNIIFLVYQEFANSADAQSM